MKTMTYLGIEGLVFRDPETDPKVSIVEVDPNFKSFKDVRGIMDRPHMSVQDALSDPKPWAFRLHWHEPLGFLGEVQIDRCDAADAEIFEKSMLACSVPVRKTRDDGSFELAL